MGKPVLSAHQEKDLSSLSFVIAVGNNLIRKKIAERINAVYEIAIHPSAVIDLTAFLGAGTVVMPLAVINPDCKIGKHVIVNSGAVVEHDCVLEDFVHIAPNVTLTGNVKIGEGTHIGAGAIILPGVSVGKWVTIGAGAVVVKDLPDNCTAVGIPAQPIKFHK